MGCRSCFGFFSSTGFARTVMVISFGLGLVTIAGFLSGFVVVVMVRGR